MTSSLSATDEDFLLQAIEISRRSLEDEGKTPFGALVVMDGKVIGRGTSSVVELVDPTAHAEVMALRDAARTVGNHLMPAGTMYSSSEPCPMCLAACYWAQLPRLVFGATTYDVATNGFEDLQLYREIALDAASRSLAEESAAGELHDQAVNVLQGWSAKLSGPVVPKY